ncbi:hypothetical protein IMZ38_02155 [Thermosphaera chiliense]|uniref:Uncharacterized protein n=1 Tax=Thermosphaera chiliense TaxID=3402707 RepID=A0A7M1UR60_9CREN|nr:hypothetical protein [Thermosphaera aggregans]QOR94755.1 hypothetical protein IMZ38_02155 [Thermosphaera aggregans]
MRHAWFKLTITLFAILLTVSATVSVNAENVVYHQGDWASYRASLNIGGTECVYRIRLTVKDVNGTIVKYSLALENLEKGDEQKCQLISALLLLGFTFSTNIERDVSALTPESKEVLINPSYTGKYTTSDGARVSYTRGVLTVLEQESSDVIVSRVKIELVDTSIFLIKMYSWIPYIVIAGLALILAAAVAFLIKRLRRKVENAEPVRV